MDDGENVGLGSAMPIWWRREEKLGEIESGSIASARIATVDAISLSMFDVGDKRTYRRLWNRHFVILRWVRMQALDELEERQVAKQRKEEGGLGICELRRERLLMTKRPLYSVLWTA